MTKSHAQDSFSSAQQERVTVGHTNRLLGYTDIDFMLREELRPVRLQLELLKAELIQQDLGIDATIPFFGSARILEPSIANARLQECEAKLTKDPDNKACQLAVKKAQTQVKNSRFYDESRRLAKLVAQNTLDNPECNIYVATGGGPGIMEAANRGAHEAGAKSLGLNIEIPHEQTPNQYVTPELAFPFHYFAIRKMHFLIRAKALVAFPGGFGTLDEIFDALTLLQTTKMKPIPLLLFCKEYWTRVLNFDALVEEGTISPEDLNLFRYVETAEEAWGVIVDHYQL